MQTARLVKTDSGSYLIFIENGDAVVTIYEVEDIRNTIEHYENLIWAWAVERGLDKVFPITQAKKTLEETHELVEAVEKGNLIEIMDAIGDVFVTLVIVSRLLNLNILECIKFAYNQIKDRTGKIIDGQFVKDSE